MADIICGGFGGQGILTTGMILADIGVKQGLDVSWSPSYGSEMRGGTANCNVIITDDEVGSPTVTYPDYLLVMNLPALEKFEHKTRKGGVIVIDNTMIDETRTFPEGVEVYSVAATDIANEIGNPKGANLVIMGAFIKATGFFSEEVGRDGMNYFFDKKGKNRPTNQMCFDRGLEAVKKVQ